MKKTIKTWQELTIPFYVLLLISLLSSNAAFAAYTFQECSNIEKSQLRSELTQLTQKIFTNEAGYIDMDSIVQSQWEASNMDFTIEMVVNNAVNKIKNDTNGFKLFFSGLDEDTAKELTEKIAKNAFQSSEFKEAINKLTGNITNQLSEDLNNISANSTTTTLQCLQAFIGNEYTSSTKYAFEQEIQNYASNLNIDASAETEINLIGQHTIGMAGIAVILTKRITQRIIKRIAQRIAGVIGKRIAGVIASKFIPFLGWASILYDLLANRDGALPMIAEALKSEEVKEKFREEISTSLNQELPQSSTEIANSISDEIFTQWIDFKKKFRNVLDLSELEPEFKAILNYTKDNEFYKLSNLVNIFKKSSKLNLIDSVKNGEFEKVMALSEKSFVILESTNSVKKLTAWEDIAGSNLTKVVEFEIYKKTPPEYYDKQRLNRLLAINDKVAISRLMALENSQLDIMLLSTPRNNLISLAKVTTDSNIGLIPPYLSLLGAELNSIFIKQLISNHNSIDSLNSWFKEVLEGNNNKHEILDYYLSPTNGYESFFEDGFVAASTNIPLKLFFIKYKTLLIFVMVTLVLLMAWRLKPVNKQA